MENKIKKGDIVYHQLSKLLFRCENTKHERWMNMNTYYVKTDLKTIDYEQWERTSER
jgi:hypothetical protein